MRSTGPSSANSIRHTAQALLIDNEGMLATVPASLAFDANRPDTVRVKSETRQATFDRTLPRALLAEGLRAPTSEGGVTVEPGALDHVTITFEAVDGELESVNIPRKDVENFLGESYMKHVDIDDVLDRILSEG